MNSSPNLDQPTLAYIESLFSLGRIQAKKDKGKDEETECPYTGKREIEWWTRGYRAQSYEQAYLELTTHLHNYRTNALSSSDDSEY